MYIYIYLFIRLFILFDVGVGHTVAIDVCYIFLILCWDLKWMDDVLNTAQSLYFVILTMDKSESVSSNPVNFT